MSWNPYATQTHNGVVHTPPSGFVDSDFQYVINLPFLGGVIYLTQSSGANFQAAVFQSVSTNISTVISLVLVNPGGTQALSVSVAGVTITVNLATSGGTTTTTLAQLVAAINGNAAASALLTGSVIGTGAGVIGPGQITTYASTPYVIGFGSFGTTSLSAAAKYTINYVTQADSVFIWTGLEFSIRTLGRGIGVRVRYNNTYLSDDYLYQSASAGFPMQSSIEPFPVFPAVILPPQSLLNFDILNFDNTNLVPSYAIVLRGYKRRVAL